MENAGMSSTNDLQALRAVFQAADTGVADPKAVIAFRQGCTRMGFYRQNFNIAFKRQQHMDALGTSTAGARLPQPHWNGEAMFFFVREVEAYVAATQSE